MKQKTEQNDTMDRDYRRIEEAIRYLDENFRRQPELREIADRIGLSEYHFQRLFRRWAGVSPKRFLQFLTAGYARELLRSSRSVLDAAFEAGLSGAGRLHDLTVNVHAATPGELKHRGAGLTIRYGFHPSPFGTSLLATTPRGICALFFLEGDDREGALGELRGLWEEAQLLQDQEGTAPLAEAVFSTDPRRKHLTLFLQGTNFQIKVWEALLRLPPGTAATYGQLAGRVGAPGAARAVGRAVGSNPVSFLIPCHRIIRQSGILGEYRWGSARKKAILGWEAARFLGEEE